MQEPQRYPFPVTEEPKPPKAKRRDKIAALVAMTPVERGEHVRRHPLDAELVRRIAKEGQRTAKKTRAAVELAQRKELAAANRAALETEEQERRVAGAAPGAARGTSEPVASAVEGSA